MEITLVENLGVTRPSAFFSPLDDPANIDSTMGIEMARHKTKQVLVLIVHDPFKPPALPDRKGCSRKSTMRSGLWSSGEYAAFRNGFRP
jgi:hypothetical protein